MSHCEQCHHRNFLHSESLLLLHGRHCKEDPIYVFLEIKLRGFVPSFHIHVSMSDLYTVMPMIVIRLALFHGCKWDRGQPFSMPDKCHVRLVIQWMVDREAVSCAERESVASYMSHSFVPARLLTPSPPLKCFVLARLAATSPPTRPQKLIGKCWFRTSFFWFTLCTYNHLTTGSHDTLSKLFYT